MDVNEPKKRMISGQGVQQLHLSLAQSQPDSGNTIIDNSLHDSMQGSTNNHKKNPDSPVKNSTVDETFVSGGESDAEDNSESSVISRPIGQYDPTIDDRLPPTVTLLTTPTGAKVYLVGTAHFSKESQDDVSTIIQAVQPNIVMVELCEARVHILQLDEETVIKEAENLNLQTIRATMRHNGVFNGIIYVLLLNISAHLTKQLGMAPGSEFRRAFSEAKKIPNCIVHLGDRPINITIQRALSSLTWWQSIYLFWTLLNSRDPISKEDVERCKSRDFLEEVLADMAEQFPSLGEVFVRERDLYLTHSLQLAARPYQTLHGVPSRVVGVVGIGHMQGIIDNWGRVSSSQIPPIMRIPPPSLSSKILGVTFKATLVGAIIYIGYKFIPMPSGSTLQSIKSSIEGLLKVSANR
ncbi:hypothetical protein PV327_004833 [Microctonus hyperodae]|uniref:TraB domain-containing protein n=1 Tax=Microctonus hyperodae TaxID=165561 RepID=A0AA39FDL7_MICHY|nr:hypothetical protein PV327_004833 [Microctonus hyperodae]